MPKPVIDPEEVEEALAEGEDPEQVRGEEEEKEEKNSLPEAPASATMRFWIDDYSVLFTIRGEKALDLINKVLTVIEVGKGKGWKPTWKKESRVEEQQQEKKVMEEDCVVDHSKLKPFQVKKEGKNKGRWFVSCQKCAHFKWVDW